MLYQLRAVGLSCPKERYFQKKKKKPEHFQPILVENIILWWSGYVSKACYHQLAPRIENAIPDYRQIPAQGPIEWADAALTAGGRRALHLFLDLGSSAGSVDQNCSQKVRLMYMHDAETNFHLASQFHACLFSKTKWTHEVNITSGPRAYISF